MYWDYQFITDLLGVESTEVLLVCFCLASRNQKITMRLFLDPKQPDYFLRSFLHGKLCFVSFCFLQGFLIDCYPGFFMFNFDRISCHSWSITRFSQQRLMPG